VSLRNGGVDTNWDEFEKVFHTEEYFGWSSVVPIGSPFWREEMSTCPDEVARIIDEVAREKKEEKWSLQEKCEALKNVPGEELLQRLTYWTGETKSNRKLDDVSMKKRHEAELWIEAIHQVMAQIGTVPGDRQDPRDSIDLPSGRENTGKMANMTADEAAHYLRLPKSSLYKGTSAGIIPHRKIGRLLRFDQADLDEYMKSNKVLSREDRDRKADEILGGRGRKRR
jgi:excisionase family DNA binding protein